MVLFFFESPSMKLNVYFHAANRIAYIKKDGDTAPEDGVLIGSFDHDALDDPLGHESNHVIYHHVRELLYKCSEKDPSLPAMFPNNITDMASIKLDLDLVLEITFTTPPSITGTLVEGDVLTAVPGVWTPTGGEDTYAWEQAEAAEGPWTTISGATSATYQTVAEDVGMLIRAKITVTQDGVTATMGSNSLGPITAE